VALKEKRRKTGGEYKHLVSVVSVPTVLLTNCSVSGPPEHRPHDCNVFLSSDDSCWWGLNFDSGEARWSTQRNVDTNILIEQHSSFLFPIARYSSLETRAGVMPLRSMLINKAIIRSLLKIYFICEQGEQISTYEHVISNSRQCKRIEHNKYHSQAPLYRTLPTILLRMRSTTGNVGRTQTRNETLMTSVGRSWRSASSVVFQYEQNHTEYSFDASWRTAREEGRGVMSVDYRNIPMCVVFLFLVV